MPELPEVETIKRGLENILLQSRDKIHILKIETSSLRLRNSVRRSQLNKVGGQSLLNLTRKAKYIVFELNDFCLISHLGMTGSWRIEKDLRNHDHVRIFLSNNEILTYNDPRRFGVFDVVTKRELEHYPRFTALGLDPILDSRFNGEYLFAQIRKRFSPIKSLIMNQQIVVGVGNIYASEALYLAGIHPLTFAANLTRVQVDILVSAIKEVLFDAIVCGGSTVSDYRQTSGSSGDAQNFLFVYGKSKENCFYCEAIIQSQVIVGRNSFWCPECQSLM